MEIVCTSRTESIGYKMHFGNPETVEKTEYPVQTELQINGCKVIICTKQPMTETKAAVIKNAAKQQILSYNRPDVETFTVVFWQKVEAFKKR